MRYTILIISILCLCSQPLIGQSILNLDFGQNFTNYKFIDEEGKEDNSFSSNFGNSLNVGYTYKLKEGVFFSSKIGFRQAGASYIYDDFNYQWKLNYSEFRLGVGYEYEMGSLSAHFSTQGYAGYLFKAEQRLHNKERDMLADETIEELDFGLFFTPGFSYKINEKLKIGLEFNYMLGLYNIEKNKEQETYNTLMGSNISLKIKL